MAEIAANTTIETHITLNFYQEQLNRSSLGVTLLKGLDSGNTYLNDFETGKTYLTGLHSGLTELKGFLSEGTYLSLSDNGCAKINMIFSHYTDDKERWIEQ